MSKNEGKVVGDLKGRDSISPICRNRFIQRLGAVCVSLHPMVFILFKIFTRIDDVDTDLDGIS